MESDSLIIIQAEDSFSYIGMGDSPNKIDKAQPDLERASGGWREQIDNEFNKIFGHLLVEEHQSEKPVESRTERERPTAFSKWDEGQAKRAVQLPREEQALTREFDQLQQQAQQYLQNSQAKLNLAEQQNSLQFDISNSDISMLSDTLNDSSLVLLQSLDLGPTFKQPERDNLEQLIRGVEEKMVAQEHMLAEYKRKRAELRSKLTLIKGLGLEESVSIADRLEQFVADIKSIEHEQPASETTTVVTFGPADVSRARQSPSKAVVEHLRVRCEERREFVLSFIKRSKKADLLLADSLQDELKAIVEVKGESLADRLEDLADDYMVRADNLVQHWRQDPTLLIQELETEVIRALARLQELIARAERPADHHIFTLFNNEALAVQFRREAASCAARVNLLIQEVSEVRIWLKSFFEKLFFSGKGRRGELLAEAGGSRVGRLFPSLAKMMRAQG